MTRWDGWEGQESKSTAPPPPKFQGSRAFIDAVDKPSSSSTARSTAIKAGITILILVAVVSFALGYLLALALT